MQNRLEVVYAVVVSAVGSYVLAVLSTNGIGLLRGYLAASHSNSDHAGAIAVCFMMALAAMAVLGHLAWRVSGDTREASFAWRFGTAVGALGYFARQIAIAPGQSQRDFTADLVVWTSGMVIAFITCTMFLRPARPK